MAYLNVATKRARSAAYISKNERPSQQLIFTSGKLNATTGNSKITLYYLKCKICNGKCTYTGKTNCIRKRTNNHIRCCRLGTATNMFDKHVHGCKEGKHVTESYFELYAFMIVKEESSLRSYEKYLHSKCYDTMNRPT